MADQALLDSDLWDRVTSGDSRAFGELWDRHHNRVFRHARRRLEHSTDAEDATAIVYLELWRRRQDARVVDGSLLPWLLVVTTNVTRNMSRSRRRHQRFLDQLPITESARDAAEIVVDRSEARDRLAGFARLSTTDQRILSLIAFEELSLEEVAEVLGISYLAAKTRLSRARARMDTRRDES